MSARHENREPGWFDTSPFFCYRRGGIVPDQSKSRTPLGTMSTAEIYGEIYGPAIDDTPTAYDDDTCQGRRFNANAKPASLWWLMWPASVLAAVCVAWWLA